MASDIVPIPEKVEFPHEYEQAFSALVKIALAFEQGGWSFSDACSEAYQETGRFAERRGA